VSFELKLQLVCGLSAYVYVTLIEFLNSTTDARPYDWNTFILPYINLFFKLCINCAM